MTPRDEPGSRPGPDDDDPDADDWSEGPPTDRVGAARRGRVQLPDAVGSEPRGPRLTPVRVILGIALLASTAVVVYGLTARDSTQLPVLTAGLFVSGVVLALLALAGAWAAYSQARDGSSLRALLYALLGGLTALAAAASLASGAMFALTLRG